MSKRRTLAIMAIQCLMVLSSTDAQTTASSPRPDLHSPARQVLFQAREAVRHVEQDRDILVANLCGAMARFGDVRGALETANSLLKESERGHALLSIAWAQAHAGDLAGALVTASAISTPELRANALTDVALALVKKGNGKAVRAIVESILQPVGSRIEALKRLAQAHRDVGNPSMAAAILREAVDFAARAVEASSPAEARDLSAPLASLALAQSRAGDEARAIATFEKVRRLLDLDREPQRHGWAWVHYLEMRAEAGDIPAALEAVMQLPPGQERDSALQRIASVQARAGQFAQAVASAFEIREPWMKALAIQAIAQEQVSIGDTAGAEETLMRISEAKLQAKSFAWVALSLKSPEQAGTAKRWFDHATALVSSNQLEMEPSFYTWLASVQASAGDAWGALERARTIQDEKARAEALGHVAHIQAEAGDWRGALDWTLAESNPRDRAEALIEIVWALLHLKEVGNTGEK